MLIKVAGKTFQVVLQDEDPQELRIAQLNKNEPGQDDRAVDDDAGNPKCAKRLAKIAAQGAEYQNYRASEERSDWPFCEGRDGEKEVKVQQPNLLACLIPGVPTEHGDGEW